MTKLSCTNRQYFVKLIIAALSFLFFVFWNKNRIFKVVIFNYVRKQRIVPKLCFQKKSILSKYPGTINEPRNWIIAILWFCGIEIKINQGCFRKGGAMVVNLRPDKMDCVPARIFQWTGPGQSGQDFKVDCAGLARWFTTLVGAAFALIHKVCQ